MKIAELKQICARPDVVEVFMLFLLTRIAFLISLLFLSVVFCPFVQLEIKIV